MTYSLGVQIEANSMMSFVLQTPITFCIYRGAYSLISIRQYCQLVFLSPNRELASANAGQTSGAFSFALGKIQVNFHRESCFFSFFTSSIELIIVDMPGDNTRK